MGYTYRPSLAPVPIDNAILDVTLLLTMNAGKMAGESLAVEHVECILPLAWIFEIM